MPNPLVEWGSARQVWFAPLSDANDKTTLVIRDDAYSRQGAVFGRKLRLGDPVDTSPKSAWVSTTWQGGEGQNFQQDEQMYKEGTADVTTDIGKMTLWPGWKQIRQQDTRQVGGLMLHAGQDWWGGGNTLHIYETENLVGVPSETSGKQGLEYDHGGLKKTRSFTHPVMGLSEIEQEKAAGGAFKKFLVGMRGGRIWAYNDDSDSYTNEHDMGLNRVNWRAMAPYNGAVYIGSQYRLSRRTWDTTNKTAKYKKVKDLSWLTRLECFTVWNNRLWFVGRSRGAQASLIVSDGTTIQEAFRIGGNFRPTELVVHYGSLYMVGYRPKSQSSSKAIGEVWRYNGTSLQKVWGEPQEDPNITDDTPIWSAVSWKNYLCWGRTARPNESEPARIMMYDHELDAIISGPAINHSPGGAVHITDLKPWQNTIVAACIDNTDYTGSGGPGYSSYVCYLKGIDEGDYDSDSATTWNGYSFGHDGSNKTERIESSIFDGDIAYEDKVWLNAKIRCAIPQGCSVTLKVIYDEDDVEQSIWTQGYDAGNGTDYVLHSIPLKVSGVYKKGQTIQYVIELNNSNTGTYPGNTPVVDSVVVEYMVAPQGRKEWTLRAVANDNLTLLDGTAHTLTTRQGIADYIEGLYDAGEPVYFWDAQPNNTTPVSAGVEVMIQSFFEQGAMLDTESGEEVSEISLNLVEFN